MRGLILFTLTAASAFCQIVSVGVKAGIPLAESFTNGSVNSNARRYLVGGTAELHLPLRFSVELDAIYKETGYSSFFQSLDIGHFSDHTSAGQLEFPLLAKYEIRGGRVRPFVDAGPVLRHLFDIKETSTYQTFFLEPTSGSSTFNNSVSLQHRNSPGFAIGGGVTLKLLHVRISPEIRYTRWGNNSFYVTELESSASSNPNQADFIVGVSF